MLMVWAVGLVVFAHIVLTRTVFGNWIFASGGDAAAARNVGVPVTRVKILMFMLSAFCAAVFAACQVLDFGSAAADPGLLKEFEAIIAVVIGGTLLTGGYGSVVGGRPRGADLWRRAARAILRGRGQLPVQGLPGADPRRCRHAQHLYPPRHHRGAIVMSKTVLELLDIEKHFGMVIALAGVSVAVREGEVHCLLGDNGAGKSTLIKTMSGVHKPTRGTIRIDGEDVVFADARDAIDRGIATCSRISR